MKRALAAFALLAAIGSLAFAAASSGISESAAGAPEAPADRAGRDTPVTLTLVAVGAAGDTLEARWSVSDSARAPVSPEPDSLYFFHTADGGYFYADHAFSMEVPPGSFVVRVARGFEYRTIVDTVDVFADTTIVYELDRWIAMAPQGWFSGDCQIHTSHYGGDYVVRPEDAWLMGRAEGLSVLNCLDNYNDFTGAPHACSTQDCIVYMSEEYRSFTYGHADLLGLSSLVTPCQSEWWPLLMDIADSVHAQPNALIATAHPISTDDFFDLETIPGRNLGREIPVDIVAGVLDAFEVLCYSNLNNAGRELDFWYRILNCDFEMPAVAGTDACVNRAFDRPMGGFKVYAKVPMMQFDFWTWLAAVGEGRTFVTNGPMITAFSVEGATPGDSLAMAGDPPPQLTGQLVVKSAEPLLRADIVRNGKVAESLFFGPGVCEMDTTFTITLEKSSWLAARVFGENEHWGTVGDSLFAHTSPVYVRLENERILERLDAEFFAEWIEDLETLTIENGVWSDPAESTRVLAEFAAAREYYESLIVGDTTGVPSWPDAPTTSVHLRPASPNPFGPRTTFRFSMPEPSRVSLRVYAPSGRLVRTLLADECPAGRHEAVWNGLDDAGRRVASGIYFCRLEACGETSTSRIALIR